MLPTHLLIVKEHRFPIKQVLANGESELDRLVCEWAYFCLSYFLFCIGTSWKGRLMEYHSGVLWEARGGIQALGVRRKCSN